MIRPAEFRDAAPICKIWNHIISNSIATFNSQEKSETEIKQAIREKSDRSHGFFVADENGIVLGFGTYGQFRGGIGYAHSMEHTIYLDERAHGLGIGRHLMQALENHARSNDVHSMLAGVSAENDAGIGFHKALGYIEVARLPEVGRKFDRWMDLVLLQKQL
ncbi:GNAT family N-acetyltransferase [Cochlodiniinecator piscidefendens]|uniref:GNAT family N-acetyltransferase n=1 Tax=Cochlodiniinecator piscidefendens TaxID=2715756 RepID=UPI0014094E18|nr:GNAT family N-acetyltransferase [Cochlodiniinecator piscidefendens]